MKYMGKTLVYLTALLFAATGGAHGSKINSQTTTGSYLGFNAQYLWVKPKVAYQSFFKKQHPGADILVGYKFNPYFSVEVGYGWTTREAKETNLIAGQQVLETVVLDQNTNVAGKFRYRNTHIDVNSYLPITNKLDGIVTVGVGFIRPNVKVTLSNSAANLNNYVSNMQGKTSAIFRAGIGFEGMITDAWGVRSMIRYENMARAKVRGVTIANDKPFKNGMSVGLGFYRYLQ